MQARSAFLFLFLSALAPAACTAFSGADTSEEDTTPRLKPKGGAGGVAGAGGEAGASAGQGGGQGGSAGKGEGGGGAGGSASGGEAGGGTTGNGGGGSPAGAGGASSGSGGVAGSGGSGGSGGGGGSGAGSGGSAGGETAPAGWQGPFRVSQAPLGQEPPGFLQCGGGVAAVSYVAGVASTSSSPCSPCACGAMVGASCVGGGMAYSLGGSSCLDINQSHPAQDWAGSCFNLQAPSNGKLVVAPLATSIQAGSCPVSGGEFSPGTYTGTHHRLCDQATGASGELCVLGPPETPCPEGWKGSSKSVAKGYEDKRTCGACSCDIQQLPTCGIDEFDLIFAENCLDFGPYPKIFQECSVMDWGPQQPGKTWSLSRKPATPKGSGSCTPKGGGVQGALTLTGPATLCCAGG